ncbi:unnamed protein product [Paramecium primaurelia]|uniref:Protein kinase domain-containing protein n=1 Tax=Paramecium primaurelia TaxID=5886 RepID=A0A8S1LFW4_PARPR|nr:unnamed protein product [Paramecium primaurelia]
MQQIDQISLQGYQIQKYDQYLVGDQFKVYKAKIVQTGELVTLKEQSKITFLEANLLRLQQCIKQQHIIEIKIFEIQQSKVFIILEKMKKSLHDFIFENEFINKQQLEKCLLFLQIVQAIQELHRFDIFHRNLKPIDFVVCEDQDKQIQIKLLDFGLVQFDTCEDLNKSLEIGSIEYLAPEIIENEYYDKSVDVWSLGVIWYQMLTGQSIFKDNNKLLSQESIYEFIEQNGNQIDRNIKKLIKQMLVIKSQERISLNLLISNLQKFCQNQNKLYLQNQEQSIVDYSNLQQQQQNVNYQQKLSNFQQQLQIQLEKQFKEELQLCLEKKQICMKKVKIEIIQDEINQNIQNLLFLNQKEQNIDQIYATSEQGYQNYLEKWQKRDDLFMQFQQEFYIQTNDMIQKQEKNIEQRWEEKKCEIIREITLQIKQQLLLDYNLQMTIYENEIREEQTYFNGPIALQQKVIQDNKKQLELLKQQLDNFFIQTQKQQQYDKLLNTLNVIQEQQDQLEDKQSLQIAQRNREFQKQLMIIRIEMDSIENEIELEYLEKKLKRQKINLENKTKNLFKNYSEIVDAQITKLKELQHKDNTLITQNQNNSYFFDKIQKLNLQRQHFNQELQQLFQSCQNQQIETLLPQIQRIQFFNENLIKISNYVKWSTQQLNPQSIIYQTQDQSNLKYQMEDLLNQLIDLYGLIQAYLETDEIQCTDINIIKDQQENVKLLIDTLNQQSEILLECQRKLQLNNLVIEENRKEFIKNGIYNQNFQIFSEQNYEEFAFELKEIINQKELVKVRLKFFDDYEFYKQIINQWNGIKSKKQELQQELQEIVEQMYSYSDNQLQIHIQKVQVLLIQINQTLKTIPSLNQIQKFNEQYQQNQISYLKLFTLIVYINLYHCQRYLNRFLSLKNKNLVQQIQQSQIESQVQMNSQNQLNQDIKSCKQEKQKIQSLIEEYRQCLKRQIEPFKIMKLQEDNEYITNLNSNYKNKIKQIILVKLRKYLNDQNLINEIINHYTTYEFQPLLFYKQVTEQHN